MESKYHQTILKYDQLEAEKLNLENQIEQLKSSQNEMKGHINVKLFEINELMDAHVDLQNQYDLTRQNLIKLQAENIELRKKDELLESEVEKDELLLHKLEDTVSTLSHDNQSSSVKNNKYEEELNFVVNITSKLDIDIPQFEVIYYFYLIHFI